MRTPIGLNGRRNLRLLTQLLGKWAQCLAVSVLLAGCGASARPDFDLNRGEVAEFGSEAAGQVFAPEDGEGTEAEWQYRIQGGDELEVVFFSHPSQNRFVKVRPDGYITLPYVGEIKAEGKTPTELGGELMQSYASVLIEPRVDVIVQEMGARFYVLGEVSRPGEFPFERRINILQALAGAGGYKNSARLTNIVLLRRDPGGKNAFAAILDLRQFMDEEGRRPPIELRPYDIVWVPRSNISRWDNATSQLLKGVVDAENVAIKGWGLANFNEVYNNRAF